MVLNGWKELNKMLKNSKIRLVILLFLAFVIRLYASSVVPLVSDEKQKIEYLKHFSFSAKDITFPFGDREIAGPLTFYVLKLGNILFGTGPFASRFIFVLFGTLSLYFIYKLVEENLGRDQGLWALLILVFDQFHIGTSRLIYDDCLVLFFSALIPYIFFKFLRTKERKWIYLWGIAMGFGYLSKELILLLLPVIYIFLCVSKKYRFLLKQRDIYIASFLIILVFMAPQLVSTHRAGFDKLAYESFYKFGFSLRSFYLYFGEIFARLAEVKKFFISWEEDMPIPEAQYGGNILKIDGRWMMMLDGSNEYPFVHWVTGVLIFISFLFYFKKNNRKPELIVFSLIMFGLVFLITSIAAGAYTLFDDHWWASMTIYPGVILFAHMLVTLKERLKLFSFLAAGLLVYLAIHSLYFINLTENQFAVPKDELCRHYLGRAAFYQEKGERKKMINSCNWIIKNCGREISGKAGKLLNGIIKIY
jgi:4-amino-4-deoxy-L-arabinose transferase-like glycosyltransferase